MSDVKRYKPFIELADDGPVATMWDTALNSDASEYPEYVLASDYDALASRLAEAERREAQAHELRNQIAAENKRLFAKVIEAERRVKELERVAVSAHTEFCYLMQRSRFDEEDRRRWRALFKEADATLSPRHKSAEGAEGEGT